MQNESENLNENETWSLVKAPHDQKLHLENGYSK